MTKREKEVLLVENLLNRFEYNSTQKIWKLPGTVTSDEHAAIQEILSWYRQRKD